MTEEKLHSGLGASASERWFNCPGSVKLLENFPDKKSKYSEEGDLAHAIGADLLSDKKGLIAAADLPEEGMDAVFVYVDYCNSIVEKHKLTPAYYWVEKKFKLPGDETHEELFGTADFVAHVPFVELEVVDYKHGAGKPVYVVNNKQLRYYALGAYLSLSLDEQLEITQIKMTIVQPRCSQHAEPINSWTITTDELLNFKDEIYEAVERTKDPAAPLVPGYWCDSSFCSARSKCPALIDKCQGTAVSKFTEASISAGVNGALPMPRVIPVERTGEILKNIDLLKTWIKAFEEEATTMAVQGVEIPGYKLVEGLGNRKWVNGIEEKLPKELFKSERHLLYEPQKLLSPAKLEKVLKENKVVLDISDLVERLPTGKQSLAEVKDKRVGKSAKDSFTAISVEVIDV